VRAADSASKSWQKGEDQPLTEADLAAHTAIVRAIGATFPHDFVLSEENADTRVRGTSSRVWIVDPIDGTKEFIAGIPEYAVSIGLCVDGEPVVGVVYNPVSHECFWAARGMGAHLIAPGGDETRLHVSTCTKLSDCVLLSSRTEQSRGQVTAWQDAVREVRPTGSAAIKLAWVAAGRGDVWLSMAPKNEWDVCAGHVLVREAGGVFVTWDGGERRYHQTDALLRPPMAAGPAVLVQALRARGGAA